MLKKNHMKIHFKFLVIILLLSFMACKEEQIGQYPVDSIPPKPISNPEVENFSGGARVTYQLPDETDLLYVKTTYTLPNGDLQEMKASVFTNSLVLKGFARSQKITLQLIAVDRSQNESQPIAVEIEPEDAAIYDIIENISLITAFGGFKMMWNNPLQEDVTVTVLKKNSTNTFELVDALYSSEKEADRAIRGQDSTMTTFGIFIKDLYNNMTDTLFFDIKPLFEVQIDNKNFMEMPKSTKFAFQSSNHPSNLSALWDDILIGPASANVYYFKPGEYEPYVTLDMGVKAKLSRFRMWARDGYYFQLHNPKIFSIMGTNDESVARNSESEDWEWDLLGTFESYRPSGLPSNIVANEEDIIYSQAGEEFEFSLEAPEVRYIRFKSHISWSGTKGLHLTELRFWGNPIKD